MRVLHGRVRLKRPCQTHHPVTLVMSALYFKDETKGLLLTGGMNEPIYPDSSD